MKVPPEKGDRPIEEDLWQRYGAEPGVWTKKMLIALERGFEGQKGGKWFSLIDKVRSEKNLSLAWEQVRSNAGACGVDGISVGHFEKDSQRRLLAVKEHLDKGTYRPQAIKRVHIPKPGSSERRPLGIPTVRDRIVQTALKNAIEPIFEKEFAPTSYGFRPGRGCKDALREVESLLHEGYEHVVDVDIKGYFDSIPHQKLMERVEERIADGRVLELIRGFLEAGVMEEGVEVDPGSGTPQGGIVSPLLANIYLDALDWLLAEAGVRMVRYADDLVVLSRSASEAKRALDQISNWMESAELTLHPEKTRVVDMGEAEAYFDFLGYRFKRSARTGKWIRVVRPKSKKGLREGLRRPTRRSNGKSLEEIIARINPRLRGWYGYFKHAHPSDLRAMDGWVRMRLRSILRKRNRKKGRGRGSDHQRWSNSYFEEAGLFSMEQARREEISLRNGAKC